MAQGLLAFKYEEEKKTTGMTALAGLPVYLELAEKMGFGALIEKHLRVRAGGQGWTDPQIVLALILLNLAGGDCVEDIKVLEADDGFCEVLKKAQMHGLKGKQRCVYLKRWRKECKRGVPSASVIFRYLEAFHDVGQEKERKKGKAFIPEPNEHLRSLALVNAGFAEFSNLQQARDIATLDQDATLAATGKAEALYCYEGYKAYQPLNTWWAEPGIILHTEFRDGNVPAGYEQLRVLQEALKCLPPGVKKVRLRSDTAGYQHNLLRYCEQGQNERFGRIEFAICSDVTQEFKKAVEEVEEADWLPIYKSINGRRWNTGSEWAEVCFVPNAIGHSKKGPAYRYLAKREAMAEQLVLPGIGQQPTLPFQTLNMSGKKYKLFGMVTNMDWDGQALIHWQHERCGKSEEAHAVMKDDLAGGKFPSGDFGENAAWWWIMVLAHNLNAIMKTQVLGESWVGKRMKAVRFSLIKLPGRVLKHARELIIRLTKDHPCFALIIAARKKIMLLQTAPLG
jgi:hypothetical protein